VAERELAAAARAAVQQSIDLEGHPLPVPTLHRVHLRMAACARQEAKLAASVGTTNECSVDLVQSTVFLGGELVLNASQQVTDLS